MCQKPRRDAAAIVVALCWGVRPFHVQRTARPMDTAVLTARTNLRSWTRRFRRGRLEPLEATAARVMAHVRTTTARWPAVVVAPATPVLVEDGIPIVYLAGQIDFWTMVQRTDMGIHGPATLNVLVHRRTLADPWECTCLVTSQQSASLASEPVAFHSPASPEAQIYGLFWRDLARRCELVLSGLD